MLTMCSGIGAQSQDNHAQQADLLPQFSYNKYKQHIIKDKIPDGTVSQS